MEDYFEGFPEDIKKWDLIKNMTDLEIGERRRKDHKTASSVQLLPRRDVVLYGTLPKMEQRIYTKCKECRLVFNPRDILSHKSCPGKSHSSTSHSLKKKVKSKGSTVKKSHSNLPPPPLFKKSPSPSLVSQSVSIPDLALAKVSSPTKISKISAILTPAPSLPVLPTTSPSSKSDTRISSSTSSKTNSHSPRSPSKTSSSNSEHSPPKPKPPVTPSSDSNCSSTSSSSNSRHKKSRKSNSHAKITKEFDPDVHCGVVEGNRGPCTRSITCNNHRIQLRKLVTGRSKDIHQLIAERKTVKEKEPKHGSNCSYTSPNGQAEEVNDSFSQSIIYEPVVGVLSNGSEPPETTNLNQTSVLPIICEPKPLINSPMVPVNPIRQTTSVVAAKPPILTETESGITKTMNNNYIKNLQVKKESDIGGGVPVIYMPLSLISIVQIGKNCICVKSQQSQNQSPPVTSQALFLPIPNQHSNTKIYKCINPKPATVPNYGAKKVGGAILLSNQRIECQRNDILMAINTINNTQGYRAISLLNHTNSPHRPNILKVKSANKVNCKRASVDKLSTCDSKQMRLTKSTNFS